MKLPTTAALLSILVCLHTVSAGVSVDAIGTALSAIKDLYGWIRKNGNLMNLKLTNKVDEKWGHEEITWYNFKNKEAKVHFVYPSYDRSGDYWRPQQAVIAAEIVTAGNADSLEVALNNIQNIAEKFDWQVRISRQNGPPSSHFYNNGKVQWFTKCCPQEFWIVIGPYHGWPEAAVTKEYLAERQQKYLNQCNAIKHGEEGNLC
jgi:hypothetical protein